MTFKTLITVVLGVGALVLGAQSALAQPAEVTSIDGRAKALGRDFQLGDFAVNNTWQAAQSGRGIYGDASDRVQPAVVTAIDARKQALGRDFALGDLAVNNTWQQVPSGSRIHGDASDRAFVPTQSEPQQVRSEGLSRTYQLGDALSRMYGSGQYAAPVADSHERVDFGNPPVSSPTVSSGSEINWPELGIGFGVGMALLLGLILTVRYTRSHPVAHS